MRFARSFSGPRGAGRGGEPPVAPLVARLFGLIAVLLVLAGATLAPAPARAQEAYTAPSVAVDVKAASPTQARQQAITEAQGKALAALLQSLTDPADHGRLPRVSDAQAEGIVVDFALANERTTANRYIADITVRFAADPVNRLLAQAGISHIRGRDAPVLVLPVYQGGPSDGPLLFEETNPWLQAWQAASGLSEGLVPIALPLGDLADVSAVDARGAIDGNVTGARQIANRYAAPDVVAVKAVGTAEAGLTITATSLQGSNFAGLSPITVEPGDDVMTRGVAQARDALENAWRQGQRQPSTAAYPTVGGAAYGDSAYPSAYPDTSMAGAAGGYGWGAADPSAGAVTPDFGTAGMGAPEGAAGMGTPPPGWQAGTPALGQPGGAPAPGTGTMGAPAAYGAGTGGGLTLLARYTSLEQWISIRRKLQSVPGLGPLDLIAVASDRAQLRLDWRGSVLALQQALMGQGLEMKEASGFYVLDAVAGAPPGGFPGMARPDGTAPAPGSSAPATRAPAPVTGAPTGAPATGGTLPGTIPSAGSGG